MRIILIECRSKLRGRKCDFLSASFFLSYSLQITKFDENVCHIFGLVEQDTTTSAETTATKEKMKKKNYARKVKTSCCSKICSHEHLCTPIFIIYLFIFVSF